MLSSKESIFHFILGALARTYHWYHSFITMETNKERIETLEGRLNGIQNGMQRRA